MNHGGLSSVSNNGSAINCYSAGTLSKKTSSSRTGFLLTNGAARTNCFYLDGIKGTTNIVPNVAETVFYKTSDDPDAMTTAKIVDEMNSYIQNPDEGVDTTGWCQWRIGDNNLPELDFDTEWNGTAWITTNN